MSKKVCFGNNQKIKERNRFFFIRYIYEFAALSRETIFKSSVELLSLRTRCIVLERPVRRALSFEFAYFGKLINLLRGAKAARTAVSAFLVNNNERARAPKIIQNYFKHSGDTRVGNYSPNNV